MELGKTIRFGESVKVDGLELNAVIPIYDTEEIFIIAKQQSLRFLPELWCKWGHYKWSLMDQSVTKDSAYGWYGSYTSKIPKALINALLLGESLEIKLKHGHSEFSMQVKDHGLRPKETPFNVVESLNPIFFDSEDILRKKTIKNFNKHCGSILRRLLPWIEFHLMHGVSQIFVSQPMRYKKNGEEWINFWEELLRPYLETEEVKLIIFEDIAEMARNNELGGCIAPATHQNISQLWSMSLSRGRSVWFGNHDLDEYIVPSRTGFFEGEKNINEILQELNPMYNFIDTRMFMVEAPAKEQILIAGNIAAEAFMPKCQKFLVKINDANLVWCHGVSNWKKPPKGIENSPLRLNHYRMKTSNGWIPSEAASIKRWNPNSIPKIYEKDLSKDHFTVLDKIEKRYGMAHGKFLRFMQQKYSHLKELKTQNLTGE
tara:strand:+ start:501 stop:1790 length:1290 start_codon:yes stop_codon:yes gene_type:complete